MTCTFQQLPILTSATQRSGVSDFAVAHVVFLDDLKVTLIRLCPVLLQSKRIKNEGRKGLRKNSLTNHEKFCYQKSFSYMKNENTVKLNIKY